MSTYTTRRSSALNARKTESPKFGDQYLILISKTKNLASYVIVYIYMYIYEPFVKVTNCYSMLIFF